jgi:hypothetical protein
MFFTRIFLKLNERRSTKTQPEGHIGCECSICFIFSPKHSLKDTTKTWIEMLFFFSGKPSVEIYLCFIKGIWRAFIDPVKVGIGMCPNGRPNQTIFLAVGCSRQARLWKSRCRSVESSYSLRAVICVVRTRTHLRVASPHVSHPPLLPHATSPSLPSPSQIHHHPLEP